MNLELVKRAASMYGKPIEKKPPHTDRMLRFVARKGREYAIQTNRIRFLGLWLEPIALTSVDKDKITEYPAGKGRSSHLKVMKRLCDKKAVIYVKCVDLATLNSVLHEYTT